MKNIILKALKEIKRGKFWLTIGIDAIFWIVIFIVSILATITFNVVPEKSGVVSLIFMAFYILALLAVYSFFKYKIIGLISEEKTKELKKRWTKLYLFNIIFTSVTVFLIYVLYMLITFFIMIKYQRIYFAIAMVLLSIIAYVTLHIMQVLRLFGRGIKDSFNVIRKNIVSILVVILPELISLFILLRMYTSSIEGSIIGGVIFILLILLMIFYNALNRILLYNCCKNK